MEDTSENNKEGPNTGGMLQEDDEMDIDAQMAQAARPTHTRRLGRLKRAHEAGKEPSQPSALESDSQPQQGTKKKASVQEGRTCSPTISQGDVTASDEKGSPALDSTHSQGNRGSPKANASSSSKFESKAESGSGGSKADEAQASGSRASHQQQESARPALASSSDKASGGHGSEGTPGKPKRRKKDKQSSKSKHKRLVKGEKAKKATKEQKDQRVFQEESAQEKYWDEEDELEEYIMKRDLGQIKERSSTDSDSSHSGSEGGDKDSDGDSRAAPDQDEDEGPINGKQLAAETQRVLREAARTDRLGKGAPQKIEPLTGILAKILERKQAIVERSAQAAARSAAAPQKQPPPKSPFASEPPGPGPVTEAAMDDEDLLLVESDEEGLAAEAGALAARRAFALQHDSLFGVDSQSQQAAPMAMPAESAPAQASRLSQGAFHTRQEPAAPDVAAAPSNEAALAVNQALDSEPPTLCLQLDSATQPELLPLHDPTPLEEAAAEGAEQEEEEADAAGEDKGGDEGGEAGSDGEADDEGSSDSSGEDSEEEEYMSSGGSSSSDGDDDEEGEGAAAAEPSSAAKQRALQEARAMLADRPRSKKRRGNALFDEEAELSEDGGHSDDDSDDDGDAAELEKLLADFIGAERDGKRDEKMRAKLHAAWLEQQDTARVEALLHGVRNGFGKKRSALDDEGGTHFEAAMRRAALMNTDDEESESGERGSGAEGTESEPEEDLQAKIDALSDDDVKEELKEAQLRKLMEESQKEEAKTMTLLDDDSRAVLGLLRRAAPELQQPLHRNAAPHRHRAPLASDITNRPPKSSFLGRGSGTAAALLAKSSSNFGNTRSFIFGSENRSNQGVSGDAAQAQDEEGGPNVPSMEGPTSFAGLHLSAGRGSLGRQRVSGLLSMLHSKESKRKDVLSPLAAEVDGNAAGGDAAQQVKAMLQSKRRAMRR